MVYRTGLWVEEIESRLVSFQKQILRPHHNWIIRETAVLVLIWMLPVTGRSCGQETTSAKLGSWYSICSSRTICHVQSLLALQGLNSHPKSESNNGVYIISRTLVTRKCGKRQFFFFLLASVIHRKALQKEVGTDVKWAYL